mmetsp:Transcript_33290/g.88059  ORF Transcript_33290/g.88059 Transcript_33290/m.88059 type:complete len:303 (-) Transcript_33290:685-1593(-)
MGPPPLLAAISYVVLATGALAHWQSTMQIYIDLSQTAQALGMTVVIGCLVLLSAFLTTGLICIVTIIADNIRNYTMAMIGDDVAKLDGYKGTIDGKGFRSRPDRQHPTANTSVEEALPLLVCTFSSILFLAWIFARKREGKSSADDSIACGEYVLEGACLVTAKVEDCEPTRTRGPPQMLEPPAKPLLTAAEQRAVDELNERVRALVPSDTLSLEAIDEFVRGGSSERFSRAKSFEVETAFAAAKSTLEFRTKVKPARIRPGDIPRALPSGCWRWAGHAKDGRPIILVRYTLLCQRSHPAAS